MKRGLYPEKEAQCRTDHFRTSPGGSRASKGRSVEEVCREVQITSFTYYGCRKMYGGLKMDQAKKLKDLKRENAQLKKVVTDLALDKAILKELARKNFIVESN
jgi:putative transposase